MRSLAWIVRYMSRGLFIGIFIGVLLILVAQHLSVPSLPSKTLIKAEVPEGYVEVTVKDVRISANGGVVFLGENASSEVLPVYIAVDQAKEIARAIHKIPSERPLTHDLFKKFLDSANIELSYVSIDRLEGDIYYATIVAKDGAMIKMDARPSDSIILALKTNVSIYASKQLMKEKSILPERFEIQSFKYETV